MGDEQQDLVPYGEPVVLAKPSAPKKKGGAGCAAPAVVLLGLFLILILLGVFSRSSSSPPAPVIGSGGNATSTPTLVALYSPGMPTPTTPPFFEIQQPDSGCHPGIHVGGSAVVMAGSVRMRQSPGYLGKNDTVDTVRYLEVGSSVNVRGGPETVDNLCWWNLEYQGSSGWSANQSLGGELLLAPAQ